MRPASKDNACTRHVKAACWRNEHFRAEDRLKYTYVSLVLSCLLFSSLLFSSLFARLQYCTVQHSTLLYHLESVVRSEPRVLSRHPERPREELVRHTPHVRTLLVVGGAAVASLGVLPVCGGGGISCD